MGANRTPKDNFIIAEDGTIKRYANAIDVAIKDIVQTISCDTNTGILVPYRTRKFFYRLCKYVGIPHSKLYVDSLLLANTPEFLEKAELGKKYLRQW